MSLAVTRQPVKRRRPAGDPAPYGLLIFSVGGTVLGISLLGYISSAAQGGSVQPIIYAGTGLGVLLCTIWAAALGQTFPAAIYGAFTGIFGSALVAAILLIFATLNGSVGLDRAAGVFVLLFSVIGFYSYLSTGLESVGGKALPLGPPVASMFSKGPAARGSP
jgi:succinate-acetate transporter protein